MRTFPISLDKGSDIRHEIEQIAQKESSSGYVLGVVGNLSKAVFQCPGQNRVTVMEGNLEIITLNGVFSNTTSHIHLSISDEACQVWGGHLEYGSVVLKSIDILLGFLVDQDNKAGIHQDLVYTKSIKVDIYSVDKCPWSKRAILILGKYGITPRVHFVRNDSEYHLITEKTGINTFPQIFINETFIGGYDELVELQRLGKLEFNITN